MSASSIVKKIQVDGEFYRANNNVLLLSVLGNILFILLVIVKEGFI